MGAVESAPPPAAIDFGSITAHDLLYCAPRLDVQLVLLAMQSVFWFSIINVGKTLIGPLLARASWYDQYSRLNQDLLKKSYFMDFDIPNTMNFICELLIFLQQHLIGGFLCIPSVFGMHSTLGISREFAVALACHGALCECGWELEDSLTRVCQLAFGGEMGKKKNPPGLLVVFGVHHAMGLSMVIPMNLWYGNNAYYHELVMCLQFAAAFALLLQQYSFTLDIKSAGGLRQMNVLCVVVFCIMCYTRVYRYAIVAYGLCSDFHANGHTGMLVAGVAVVASMSLLNILFVVDATTKLAKFLKLSLRDSSSAELEDGLIRVTSSGNLMKHPSASKALRPAGACSPKASYEKKQL